MKKNTKKKSTRYYVKSEGVGTSTYFKVKSSKSKEEYPVEISFKCTCKHHSLFPYDKKPCKVVKAAMRKMIK